MHITSIYNFTIKTWLQLYYLKPWQYTENCLNSSAGLAWFWAGRTQAERARLAFDYILARARPSSRA